MLFNSKIENRFGFRCFFKGGGGGLTGSSTTTEQAFNQEASTSGSGATVSAAGGNISGGVSIETSDPEVTEAAIAGATNDVTTVADLAATYGQGQVQENLSALGLADNVESDLAAISANAAPQSTAAESELLSGTNPLPSNSGQVITSGLANGNNIIWIGVGLFALVWYSGRTK
jgi:hypothetical protein